MKHLLVTFSFLVAACACYLIGYAPAFRIFFVFGIGFEIIFWIRLLNRRYKSNQRLKALQDSGQAGDLQG